MVNRNSTPQNDINETFRPEDLLTTGQASRELRVSTGTMQNWRYKGEGPKFIKHRRNVYYLKSEILAYKRKYFGCFGSTAEYKAHKYSTRD